MRADPQIREVLARAAAEVQVDVERAYDRVLRTGHRDRSRRVLALTAAASVILVSVWLVWDRSRVDQGFVGPTELQGKLAVILRDGSQSELYSVDLETGARTALAPGAGSPTAAQWSPDGERIAFTVEVDGGARYALVVARADGSDPVTLIEHEKAEGTVGPDFVSVAWSPDGERIAYSGRTIFRGRTVSVLKADGTGARVLDGFWTSVTWSPDGDHLLLLGWPDDARKDVLDLYRARPDGTEIVRLTDGALPEHNASWSPDGARIVFARADGPEDDANVDVFVMNADGTNVRRLTDPGSFDALPVWSPDGKWIAFTSDRDSPAGRRVRDVGEGGPLEMSLYVMRADGSGLRRVPVDGGYSVLPLSWK